MDEPDLEESDVVSVASVALEHPDTVWNKLPEIEIGLGLVPWFQILEGFLHWPGFFQSQFLEEPKLVASASERERERVDYQSHGKSGSWREVEDGDSG